MRPNNLACLFIMVLLLSLAGELCAQQYPAPSFAAGVLFTTGQSNSFSGDLYSTGSPVVPQTYIRPLSMPQTNLPGTGGPVNCGNSTDYPLSFIVSGPDWGAKGLDWQGSFNSPYAFNLYDSDGNVANMFQSVFMGDNPCYNGGRELGFFLATTDNSIWAYWGTQENLKVPGTQGQVRLSGVSVNTTYIFTMYPVSVPDAPGGCKIQLAIYQGAGSLIPEASQNYNVTDAGGDQIISQDAHFCDYLLQNSPYQETNYVSANITPGQPLSGTIPSNGFSLNVLSIGVYH